MSLTIKEFDINELRAGLGKPLHGVTARPWAHMAHGKRFVNFYYGDNRRRVPNIQVYGGMEIRQGKFDRFLELDLKDDESEEFFKSLGDQLKILAGGCLDEKPRNLKFPLVEYGPYYSVHCKIFSNWPVGNLKAREYFHGYCEIRPYHAFCEKTKGITLIANKIVQ